MLQHAVTCGLLAAGCEVVDLGVLPTPTMQMYVAATRARGGLAITASHNPPEYNALKLFNAKGCSSTTTSAASCWTCTTRAIFHRGQQRGDAARVVGDRGDATRYHIDRVLTHVDARTDPRAEVPRRAGRASTARARVMTLGFLQKDLGCDAARDLRRSHASRFRAWPSRGPTRSASCRRWCARSAPRSASRQDPDGDRLAVVDETGRVLDNDDVLALAVDAVLRRVQGDVVVNLTTSSVIDDVARAHGRRVYRTPVGEANVVEMMQAVNAVIGGEGSNGGIIFPAVHLCRDSYTGMALLLDRMAETGKTISELAARAAAVLAGSWARCPSSTAAWA